MVKVADSASVDAAESIAPSPSLGIDGHADLVSDIGNSTLARGYSLRKHIEGQGYFMSLFETVIEKVLCMPTTKFGRAAQMIQVLTFAILAAAGIFVQVYTDAELSEARSIRSTRLNILNAVSFEMYDIMMLLSAEMDPFYQYNRGSYDIFLQKAQIAMRQVDNKLIWITNWPSDLSALPVDQRGNLTSSLEIRNAIRQMRDMRKAPNGTAEEDVINFYSTLVDNLAVLIRTETLQSERFTGWREFLTIFYTYQTVINFKKYALVGRKLTNENRTVTFEYPLYQNILLFHTRYTEFLEVLAICSDAGYQRVRNLTDQDVFKDLDVLHQYVLNQDFIFMPAEDWNVAMPKHEANILWIIASLKDRVQAAMTYSARTWFGSDVLAVVFFTFAAAFAILAVVGHIFATWSIQRQIVESHRVLLMLNDTLVLLYDSVPRAFIKPIMNGDNMAPKHFDDTCVMLMDITNITDLMLDFDAPKFSEMLTNVYELIESRLVRYNCFKIDVLGDTMCLASGVGEYHSTDHIGEMLYLALELCEDFQITDYEDRSAVHMRFAVHAGPCYARIFSTGLRVPQVGLFGPALQIGSLVHATGLSMKVHVSQPVYNRMAAADEVDFMQRGNLIQGKAMKLPTYWARWSDSSPAEENGSLISRHSGADR